MSDDHVTHLTVAQRIRTEAERILPELLDLSGPAMQRELARRPELHHGILQLLLPLLAERRAIQPQRVYELSAVLVAGTAGPLASAPAPGVDSLHGWAWTEHAAALSALGRYPEAREAIAVALDLCRRDDLLWHIANAEVVEAEILHALGKRAEALRTIRSAAPAVLRHGDRQRYAEARMAESWMLWDAGNRAAAAEVWKTVGQEAEVRGDRLVVAHMSNRIGVFELRQGNIDSAVRCFGTAAETFAEAGLLRESAFVHRNLGEAEVARCSFLHALFAYYAMRDDLLAAGDLTGAAQASVEILDLLFLTGQYGELLDFGNNLIAPFLGADMTANARRAWTFVLDHAASGDLTRDDIDDVRLYFQELPLRPNAPFLPAGVR